MVDDFRELKFGLSILGVYIFLNKHLLRLKICFYIPGVGNGWAEGNFVFERGGGFLAELGVIKSYLGRKYQKEPTWHLMFNFHFPTQFIKNHSPTNGE